MNYYEKTQAFSTWGDKLLQHADRLHEIQSERQFRPITLQLAPTEVCDSDCSFCSVQNRPGGRIPWDVLEKGVRDFAALGIKAIELTGGGNPTLYRDGKRTLNDVIALCSGLGLDIGVITNSEDLRRHLSQDSLEAVKWVRVSLAKLDEGCTPDDYSFDGVPDGKLGLSYIVHNKTTHGTFAAIQTIVQRNPAAKFVRIAADCLTEESLTIKDVWGKLIEGLDSRFFIKEINDNFHAYPRGCWIGMIRPYWVSTGIYICTSHVLQKRTYLPAYKLCDPQDITETWAKMNARFKSGLTPYEIDIPQCQHCYYHNPNKILATVINELPDKNFA